MCLYLLCNFCILPYCWLTPMVIARKTCFLLSLPYTILALSCAKKISFRIEGYRLKHPTLKPGYLCTGDEKAECVVF